MNIKKYFSFAKNVSGYSDFCGDKVSRHIGCVMIHRNRTISVGWNISREHPVQKKYNKDRGFDTSISKNSLHAEMYALIKSEGLDIDWSKVKIFVYRELADGSTAMAKPCIACMQAIKDRGIKTAFYTTENGYIKEVFGEKERNFRQS